MRVWLDDVRTMPVGFDVHVKTAKEAIELLKTNTVTKISLDHDLGNDEDETGYVVACYIEEMAESGELNPIDCNVHSANPVGSMMMNHAIDKAELFWFEHKCNKSFNK